MVSKVLVLGSGAIKIGEAAEFDYSGSQALKALKEEGIETILINPNVATIQTSHEMADKVYFLPLDIKFMEEVIKKEKPDGILLGFGGQSALSLGVALHDSGILEKYNIKVLGTPIEGIKKALDREKFRKTMIKNNLPIPPSKAAKSVEEALKNRCEVKKAQDDLELAKIRLDLSQNDYTPELDKKNAKINLENAKINLEKVKRQITREINQLFRDMEGKKANIQITQRMEKLKQEIYGIAQKQYKAGLISATDLLDAQIELTQAQLSSVDALFEYNLAKAKFIKALAADMDYDKKDSPAASKG